MVGVAIGSMALIVVLSVLNGFENVVKDSFSAFDPSLKIIPAQGKSFSSQDSTILQAKALKLHTTWCEIVEQDGLIAGVKTQHKLIVRFHFSQSCPSRR